MRRLGGGPRWTPDAGCGTPPGPGQISCLHLQDRAPRHRKRGSTQTRSKTKQYYLTNPCEGHVAPPTGTLTQWKHLGIQEGAAWSPRWFPDTIKLTGGVGSETVVIMVPFREWAGTGSGRGMMKNGMLHWATMELSIKLPSAPESSRA